ncbi:MAG: hypothetical protein BGO30_07365 [Bacteroidetes bacterium 41-46]|nr:MAG: hypothetical protein BGO30_07365 [Bacteroidetes bacterium 41-46]
MGLRKQIAKADFCIGENLIRKGDILLISGSIYRMNGHVDYAKKVFRSSGEYLGEYRASYIDGLERNGDYGDCSGDEEKKLKLESAAHEMFKVCSRLVEHKYLILPPEPIIGVSEEYKDEFIALSQLLAEAKAAIQKATD